MCFFVIFFKINVNYKKKLLIFRANSNLKIMNNRKLFYSMMVVALATAMSVGFTSCSKDDKPEYEDKGYVLMDKIWYSYRNAEGGIDYGIEFNRDETYSYNTIDENFAGNFRIFEIQKSKGVISYIWDYNGREYETEDDFTLYKMLVSGSSSFDQLWVYYFRNENYGIVCHFYSNNELVRKPGFNKDPS